MPKVHWTDACDGSRRSETIAVIDMGGDGVSKTCGAHGMG